MKWVTCEKVKFDRVACPWLIRKYAAMSAALDAGLEVTALHHHFFFDEPNAYFMHIGGHGETKALAAGVKKIYGKIAQQPAILTVVPAQPVFHGEGLARVEASTFVFRQPSKSPLSWCGLGCLRPALASRHLTDSLD